MIVLPSSILVETLFCLFSVNFTSLPVLLTKFT